MRMSQRNAIINTLKHVVVTIKSIIPEFMAAIGMTIVVFFLIPIFIRIFAR